MPPDFRGTFFWPGAESESIGPKKIKKSRKYLLLRLKIPVVWTLNESFLRLMDLRHDASSRHGLRANRTSRDMNNDKPTLLHSNPYNLFLQVWKLLKH